MSETREPELRAALATAERALSYLRAERETIEEKIRVARSSPLPDLWLIQQMEEELLAPVNDRIDVARAGVLRPKIDLLKMKLLGVRAICEPQRIAFEESRTRYRAAIDESNKLGFEYDRSKLRVNSMENEIIDAEKTLEELRRKSLSKPPSLRPNLSSRELPAQLS